MTYHWLSLFTISSFRFHIRCHDPGIFLFRQYHDLFGICFWVKQTLTPVSPGKVKCYQLRMIPVLRRHRKDLFPGPELIVGGNPHLIESFHTPLRHHYILFHKQRQDIKQSEQDQNMVRCDDPSQDQSRREDPASYVHPLLPWFQFFCVIYGSL